jgi:hypothetical protein
MAAHFQGMAKSFMPYSTRENGRLTHQINFPRHHPLFGLGLGRRSGAPVQIVCSTSDQQLAGYLPETSIAIRMCESIHKKERQNG